MKNTVFVFYVLMVSIQIIACGPSEEYNHNESVVENEVSGYPYQNGTFCADIDFHNPNTGTRSTYQLNVEVEERQVVKIYWPNGGWLDEDHFTPEELDENHQCSFTSDKGYSYDIEITGEACGETTAYLTLEQCAKALQLSEKELLSYESTFNTNRNVQISEKVCESMMEYFINVRKIEADFKRSTDSIKRDMKKLNTMIENGYIQNVHALSAKDRIVCQLAIVKKKKVYYLMRIFSTERCNMGVMNFDHRSYGTQTVTVQENPNINKLDAYQAQIITQGSSYAEMEGQLSSYCSF